MKNVALIGCGRITQRHIEAIATHPDLRVAVVCDMDESRAAEVAAGTGARTTTDMCDLAGVDIAAVLTPSGFHPKHTMEIARNTDVPVIITEKPIALKASDAREVFDCLEKEGKRFVPVYQNRYNPLIAFVRDLVLSGKLGRVYHFVCNVLWHRGDSYFAIDWHGTEALDGGVLYTQASHYIDMLHFFFGELESYNGVGGKQRNFECYDSMAVSMRFRNGTLGSLNASVNAYEKNYATELTLLAEKGVIHLNGTNLNQIGHWNVEGIDKPDMEFALDHEYGKGHDFLYRHILNEDWAQFPTRQEVLSGITMMETLSFQEQK